MPCFYCGKRVSLVRQLNDADFCSDDHRRRYHELTRLALDRLLEANQQLGAPAPRPAAARQKTPARPMEFPAAQAAEPVQSASVFYAAPPEPEVSAPVEAAEPEYPVAAFLPESIDQPVCDREAQRQTAETPAFDSFPVSMGDQPHMQLRATAGRLPMRALLAERRNPAGISSERRLISEPGGRSISRPLLQRIPHVRARLAGLVPAGFLTYSVLTAKRSAAAHSAVVPAPSGLVCLPVSGLAPLGQHFTAPVEPAAVDRFLIEKPWPRPIDARRLAAGVPFAEPAAAMRALPIDAARHTLPQVAWTGAGFPAPSARGFAVIAAPFSAAHVHPRIPKLNAVPQQQIERQASAQEEAGLAQLGPASYFPIGMPAGTAGEAMPRTAAPGFAAAAAALPALGASGRTGRLGEARVAMEPPRAVARRAAPAGPLPDTGIEASEGIRLAAFALSVQRPGALLERPLGDAPQPAPRARSFTFESAPAAAISCSTLLPPAPAYAAAAHLLPERPHMETTAAAMERVAFRREAAVQATAQWTAVLPVHQAGRASALALVAAGAMPGRGTAQRGTFAWKQCAWQAMASTTPEVCATTRAARTAAVESAGFGTPDYLLPGRKAPGRGVPRTEDSRFAEREMRMPAARQIRARITLECPPAATVPPRSLFGAAPVPVAMAIAFALHAAILPDISRAEGTLARTAEQRRIEATSFQTGAAARPRDIAKRGPRAAAAPVAQAGSPEVPEPAFFAVAMRGLAQTSLQEVRGASPRPLACTPRTALPASFACGAPVEPASVTPAARHELAPAGTMTVSARAFDRGRNSAPAEVVATGTQSPELPGPQRLEPVHDLATTPARTARMRPLDRTAERRSLSWAAIAGPSPVAFASMESHQAGVQGQARAADFAEEPYRGARAGAAERIVPQLPIGFAAPVVHEPRLPNRTLGICDAPGAKLASPAARDDSKTVKPKARLTPASRLSNRPSRLPVFHATVEKAHMPAGTFYFPETEDVDDERTSALGGAYPAPPVEPRIPNCEFPVRSREALDSSPLLPVSHGPYPGSPAAAPGFGESPYTSELLCIEDATKLDGMDFEAIADLYEPRWRSALKTASGFFRGVMLFIPGIVVLSSLLAGCSANGGSLKDSIQNRAAIRMEHDFSQGLHGWYGGRDWAKTWAIDPAGYIKAGHLALHRASQQLSDYRMEFLGQIDGRGMGWVYRAADLQNYYATKLVVVTPGPLPTMALVRYQVVGGQETQRVQVPLRAMLHNGRPYRIQQDVSGHGFTTLIEGEVVDFWTDDRLRAGGVGFFADENDSPHLYWMKVTYNDDFWGNLCASIAPAN